MRAGLQPPRSQGNVDHSRPEQTRYARWSTHSRVDGKAGEKDPFGMYHLASPLPPESYLMDPGRRTHVRLDATRRQRAHHLLKPSIWARSEGRVARRFDRCRIRWKNK